MDTRRLGGTGPELTRLGLGLAALGRPAYITLGHAGHFPEGRSVEAMEAHAHGVFDRAYAGGIRYFDAARSYGRGEQFLRDWLEARGHRDVVVGSKWGYRYTGDWQVDGRVQEVKEHSAAMLRMQVAESAGLLGPWLRLYQIHSATEESGVLRNAQVLDELRRLREGGLFLGVTTTGPRQVDTIRRAMEIRAAGEPLFSAVQSTWNLLERSAEPALREAHAAGMTVLVKEPLANGRLAPGGDVARLGEIAARLGSTADAVALAAVLQESWADVVLLGAATPEQLASNLSAPGLRLLRPQREALESLRVPAAEYWAFRSSLPWT